MTRSVGSTASLIRCSTRPSGSRRSGDRLHALVGQLPGHLGHEAHRLGELRAAEGAVQDRDVERVHQVLVVLEPVARDDGGPAAAHAAVVGLEELARRRSVSSDLVARQHGLALGRAHVGEDQSVALLHRIPGLAHPLALRGRRRARTAARGSGPPRRRASRDSSSGCRAPPPGRSRAWCRDARSARSTRPGRPRRSRKSTRSSPSTRTAFGVSPASPARPTGCQ